MTLIKLTASATPLLKNTIYSISCLMVLLASLAVCQSAAAQNIQRRPVARLVSEPASAGGYARPRRVTPAEGSSSNDASNTTPATKGVANASASLSLDDATQIERRAFEQTNQARIANGLPPVEWDSELCRLARAHSEKMAQQGYLSHETPEGLQLKDRAHRNGLHFRVIGENIAYNKGYDDPGAFAVERWLISSGHRANILYVGFQTAAIGSYVSADGSVYLTQVFIAR